MDNDCAWNGGTKIWTGQGEAKQWKSDQSLVTIFHLTMWERKWVRTNNNNLANSIWNNDSIWNSDPIWFHMDCRFYMKLHSLSWLIKINITHILYGTQIPYVALIPYWLAIPHWMPIPCGTSISHKTKPKWTLVKLVMVDEKCYCSPHICQWNIYRCTNPYGFKNNVCRYRFQNLYGLQRWVTSDLNQMRSILMINSIGMINSIWKDKWQGWQY